MFRIIIRLILTGCVALILFKISTFGWWYTKVKNNAEADLNIKPDRLKDYVYVFSRKIGNRDALSDYKNLLKAADYIAEEFKRYGYEVLFQEYIAWDRKVKNIIAVKRGSVYPEEIVVVGAHYDTCGNPGADDNSSGIAGLLELARIYSKGSFKRTIQFVAFVNEEPPFFQTKGMGSLVFARQARAENKDIKAALVLESIGFYSDKIFSQRYPPLLGLFYPNKGNYLAVIGNLKSTRLAKNVEKGFKRKTSFLIRSLTLDFLPAASFSDHWSFWQAGYPAVMITDTAFLRNHNYHQATDTFETLNYEYMAQGLYGLKNVIYELAQ